MDTILSPPSVEDPDVPSSSATKKRKLLNGACQRCRQKKIACEGGRPSCAACSRVGFRCNYEHGIQKGESRLSALRRELNIATARLHKFTTAAQLLKAASSKEADEIVVLVRQADDPAEALSTVPQMFLGKYTPPDIPVDPALSGSQIRMLFDELCAKHPTSFPIPAYQDANLRLQDASTELPLLNARLESLGFPGHDGITTSSTHDPGPSSLRGSQESPLVKAEPFSAQQSDMGSSPLSAFSEASPPWYTDAFVDLRLYHLDMTLWTEVPISNHQAASMLSCYLQTDHPLLGLFDSDLFVTGLCGGHALYCSPFLVSALFYCICHGYKSMSDESAELLSSQFLEEAQMRWQEAKVQEDNMWNVAACIILSLALEWDGNGKLADEFRNASIATATRLRLFDPQRADSDPDTLSAEGSSANEYRAKSHIAWGMYCYLCLHAAVHHSQPPVQRPHFYIPGDGVPYMGKSFQAICDLWLILSEDQRRANASNTKTTVEAAGFPDVEQTIGNLLRWADNLEAEQRRFGGMPQHVCVLHIWYHSALLNLIRPYSSSNLRITMFESSDSNPKAIYEASLFQLKCLILQYLNSTSTLMSCASWHLTLLQIENKIKI